MRPDHTAAEFVQTQPLRATPLEGAGDSAPRRKIRILARVSFCFAWLLGLEPFLTGPGDEIPKPRE